MNVDAKRLTNLVRDPGFADSRGSWKFESPPGLEPNHKIIETQGVTALSISATSDIHAFGYWHGEVSVQADRWYEAKVYAKVREIRHPELSIFANLGNHFLKPLEIQNGVITLGNVVKLTDSDLPAELELYLRAAECGSVEYYKPVVVECEAPPTRRARVASVRFDSTKNDLDLAEQRERLFVKLEEAGRMRPDIVVTPEMSSIVGVPKSRYGTYQAAAEEVEESATVRIASDAARRGKMYVVLGMIVRRGDHCFNTALIIDRNGNIAGRYEKTHLTFTELREGLSCGTKYPLFDLDFGRIAIHICYDEWFPEVVRYYAHKDAEIVFLPVWGGKPMTWRTRALDNRVYFVASSVNPPSMIIDSSGAILAETHTGGIACADLDLSNRQTNVYIDPTLSHGMPYIVPHLRYTSDESLIGMVSEAMLGYRGASIDPKIPD